MLFQCHHCQAFVEWEWNETVECQRVHGKTLFHSDEHGHAVFLSYVRDILDA